MNKPMHAILVLMLAAPLAGTAYAQAGDNGRRVGPPEEAFTACEGRQAGDVVSFENRRGNTIEATCQQRGERLVAMPERRCGPKGGNAGQAADGAGRSGKRCGPPEQAFTACEGQSEGAAVTLTTPRGREVEATCRSIDGRLAAVPARGKGPKQR